MNLRMFLKQMRFNRKYNSKTLAEKLGISVPYYNMIENGTRDLTIPLIKNIVTVLELTPIQEGMLKEHANLKEYRFVKKQYNKSQQEILHALNINIENLTEEKCRKIISLLNEGRKSK